MSTSVLANYKFNIALNYNYILCDSIKNLKVFRNMKISNVAYVFQK
jgi:hypothetical protein